MLQQAFTNISPKVPQMAGRLLDNHVKPAFFNCIYEIKNKIIKLCSAFH